jgi:diketogulonate reductase-like aldo/keto reductase
MLAKSFSLGNGEKIPSLGLGTWQLQGSRCIRAVRYAIEVGYRHIDTAAIYQNHEEVGKGIYDAEVERQDLFITSKVWRDDLKFQQTIDACHRALDELELDYLDLYLIHWPNKSLPVQETLEAMQELKEKGLIKAIGVSNFTTEHIKSAQKAGVEIVNNQVEYHPSLNQEELLAFCEKEDILLTAYSPLARGDDLELEVIQELAQKYEKSPAQVVLNWLISKGIVAIPKASTKEHIQSNWETLSWELELADVERIDGLNSNTRLINPGFAKFD